MTSELQTYAASLTCWAIFLGSVLLVHLLLRLFAMKFPEVQGEQSAQNSLLANAGGLAIFIPFAIVCILALFRATPFMVSIITPNLHIFALFISCTLIVAFGWFASFWRIRFRYQLLVQIAIAIFVCSTGLVTRRIEFPGIGLIELGPVTAALFSIIWMIAFANSLRFLEGLDPLLAAVAFVCLLGLAMVASLNATTIVVLLSLAIAGGTLGYLLFRLSPVKMPLGQSGKYLIGFAIGVITLMGEHKRTGILIYWIPLLLLGFHIPRLFLIGSSSRQLHPSRERSIGLQSAILPLVVAGVVASLGYAILEFGDPRATWWFAGQSKMLLLASVFGITWLAMNLRPIQRSWQRHRTQLILSDFAQYAREQLQKNQDYVTVNSLIAILQDELGLDGLEISSGDSIGEAQILGFRPSPSSTAETPPPIEEMNIETEHGTHLLVRTSYATRLATPERDASRQHLREVLAQWAIGFPVPSSTTGSFQRDAEGQPIFPIPAIQKEWQKRKSLITL